MSGRPIRVLIVDDSAVVRGLMARAIEVDPDIVLAGTAMHGQAALSFLQRESADVVVLDVEMPVMDGLTALQRIQVEFPSVQVIMASSLTQHGAETTVRALSYGAVGCIGKPAGGSAVHSVELVSKELVPLIKAVAKRDRVAVPAAVSVRQMGAAVRSAPSRPNRCASSIQVVVIGTSTGGPRALNTVLTGLPQDFPLPILIVQHMPPMFTPMLAQHIQSDTGRRCAEAVDGGRIEAGWTYVAPGNFHMEINGSGKFPVTRVHQGPEEHYCRPSVNPLFQSAAKYYGNHVLAITLTGMGEDGIEGSRALSEAGAFLIAQDEASSVVWGMPGAVVRENLHDECMPLAEISSCIMRHCLAEAIR